MHEDHCSCTQIACGNEVAQHLISLLVLQTKLLGPSKLLGTCPSGLSGCLWPAVLVCNACHRHCSLLISGSVEPSSNAQNCSQVVDLDALRELCWSGVPADLRPLCWRLLSGYLPPNRDRRYAT